ncbi:MAG: hypothetical protein ABIH92_00575 [Nanoarchaeota archaeon]
MGDSIIDFLDEAFPLGKSKRRTLTIPQSSVRDGKIGGEVAKKLTELFEDEARRWVVYLRQKGDGSYEIRSYEPAE